MISKIRKNCKNKISKRAKIYVGGKVYDWNLGPIILKKEKGLLSDTYWIEYPTDPIENGWTQIAPTQKDPEPKYSCSNPIKPPKEEYNWHTYDHTSKILDKIIIQRPLSDGSFVPTRCNPDSKMCSFDYWKHNQKLSEQIWQKSIEIPNTRINGKKEFIRNFHTLYIKRSDKGIKAEINRDWTIKPAMKRLYFLFSELLLNYDINAVPSEFIDLYKDVKNDLWQYDFIVGSLIKNKIERDERE